MINAQPVAKRILVLEIGRGVAALLVALFHCTEMYEKYFGITVFDYAFRGGHAGVNYFFVLSGFIIYTSHAVDIGRPDRFLSFAVKRAVRILPMYWLVVSLMAVAFLVVPGWGADKAMTPAKALFDFLLIPRDGTLLLPPAWTLQREMIFYAAFALLLLLPRLGMPVFVVWQLAILVNTIFPFSGGPLAEAVLDINNIGFAIGMIAAYLVWKDRISAPRLLAALGLFGFAAGMVAEWYFVSSVPAGSPVFGGLCERLYYTGCAALAVPALVAWEQRTTWRIPRFWAVFGGASYLLYLAHEPISSVVAKVLSAQVIKPMLTAPVAFGINMAVVVAAAMIGHILVEKPVLSRLRTALRIGSVARTAAGPIETANSGRTGSVVASR